MALDTDSNFTVAGYTGEASVATDYSAADSAHYQVVKVAYGDTADFERVTASQGLPVSLIDVPATINLNSVVNPVTVNGTVSVFGIAGATAIGVTASDLDIRNLTAGSVTAGSPSTSTVDIVRVVGYSGGWAVGVTATDLDIRNLDFNIDSVSVSNTVTIVEETSPYSSPPFTGLGIRTLRASTGADPIPANTSLLPVHIEDVVRVIGLSGAYPVDALGIGVTNIANRSTRVPFHVDDTGALYVNLAAGSISVTAEVSSSAFILSGVSLAYADTLAKTVKVSGYTGSDVVPVAVVGASFDIRGLTSTRDSVYADIRPLTAGDVVSLGGTAGLVMTNLETALAFNDATKRYQLKTDDVSTSQILEQITTATTGLQPLANSINTGLNSDYRVTGAGTLVTGETSFTASSKALRVVVANVVQPDGITSGRLVVSTSAVQMNPHVLKSGVHFKSDLGNSNATIFIGSNNQNQIGYPLYNGDQIFIETDNTNKIFYSATAGATLYYMGT